MKAIKTSKQKLCENEITKGKSLVFWVIGYVNLGSAMIDGIKNDDLDLKLPIFEVHKFDKLGSCVLIERGKEMVWINVANHNIHYGYGGEDSPAIIGKRLQETREVLNI